MKRIQVPPSVRKRARKFLYERFILLFIYLLIAYIVIDYIYEGLKTTDFGNLSTTVFLTYLIPFWASGVPLKLIDRDYYGEIIKISLENNDPAKIDNYSETPVTVNALIRTPDGKLYEREIFDEGEFFSGERENVYKVSDRVVHVRWTGYITPVRLPDDNRPITCVICGNKAPSGTKECRVCKCSMDIRLVDVKRNKK